MFLLKSLGYIAALTAADAPAESLDYRFEAAAHAVAYASPCKGYGYPVDVTRIRKEVLDVQREAIAAGMSEQEAGDRFRTAVNRKFDRLNERITRAGFMPRTSEASRRFEIHLQRQCPKIPLEGSKVDR